MLLGVRLVNSLGLAGIPVGGYDIGGFVDESSPKLFARWLSIAAFAPFFRVHSMINSRDSEPWAYGEEVEEISRNYINLRYKLMPYFYSLFHLAHKTGLPINRTLAIDYTNDPEVYNGNAQNEFTLGQWLLVCPTVSTQDYAKIYLPEGNWYNFFTDELNHGKQHLVLETGMEDLPVYAKEGSIIPIQSGVQYTRQAHDGILRLHIYNGQVQTEQNLYEDDGETFDFQKGAFAERIVSFDGVQHGLKISQQIGDFNSKFNQLKIYFHGFSENEFNVDGVNSILGHEDLTLIDPITEFDPLPQRHKKHLQVKALKFVVTAYGTDEINVNW
jgi:alpha-glucosidase